MVITVLIALGSSYAAYIWGWQRGYGYREWEIENRYWEPTLRDIFRGYRVNRAGTVQGGACQDSLDTPHSDIPNRDVSDSPGPSSATQDGGSHSR